MPSKRDIVPITRFKAEATELVRRVNEEGRLLIVTQNGEARVVVMDVGEFDRMNDALALLKMIAQGEADVAASRTRSVERAFEQALRDLNG